LNLYTDVAVTGLVVLKFVERAKDLGLNPFDTNPVSPTYFLYAQNVINGFDFIFDNAALLPGGLVRFPLPNPSSRDTYSTAIVMMAVAATNAPTRVIGGTGALTGWTYAAALQGMMDWMVDAQGDDSDCDVGGWGYNANPGLWADQSNTGYATLGLGFAAAAPPSGFGLTIPSAVLTKLSTYIDNVQDPDDGGSLYEPCTPYRWVNILKTGNLLYEMALVGDDVSEARVQNAINYIQNHWNATGRHPDSIPPTSLGWKDSYQAMFTMMKGLEAFGIDTIGVGINWFDEVSDVIVSNQDPVDGFWYYIDSDITEGEESPNLRAIWAMLT